MFYSKYKCLIPCLSCASIFCFQKRSVEATTDNLLGPCVKKARIAHGSSKPPPPTLGSSRAHSSPHPHSPTLGSSRAHPSPRPHSPSVQHTTNNHKHNSDNNKQSVSSSLYGNKGHPVNGTSPYSITESFVSHMIVKVYYSHSTVPIFNCECIMPYEPLLCSASPH